MVRTKVVATLALLLSVEFCMALNVTPINFELVSYDIDSIRAKSADSRDFIAQLEIVQNSVKADKGRLDVVSNQIKLEKRRYVAERKVLKEKEQQIKLQEKGYKSELKLHKTDKKSLEKERSAILKNETLDSRTQQAQLQDVSQREQRLTQDINACQKKLRNLKSQREKLKDEMISLAEYNYEIQNKENAFKQMRNTNKYQTKHLKGIISTEKDALKNAKKQ